jgi:hypothetical protein
MAVVGLTKNNMKLKLHTDITTFCDKTDERSEEMRETGADLYNFSLSICQSKKPIKTTLVAHTYTCTVLYCTG